MNARLPTASEPAAQASLEPRSQRASHVAFPFAPGAGSATSSLVGRRGRTWKPDLIAETERVDPHDSQVMKNSRLSLVRSVSGDLHVLHVTYSTVGHGQRSLNGGRHEPM